MTSLSGSFDPIPIPANSQKLDREVEIVIVIGKKATLVSEQEAANYIAGYALVKESASSDSPLRSSAAFPPCQSCEGYGKESAKNHVKLAAK